MIWFFIVLAVACLAYANGSNDNFKGVATLFGSGTTNYRGALTWATLTTMAGSLTAVFLAESLLKAFSGKGLVDDALTSSGSYGAAVALGAALTVLIATRVGMPISTTHALVGALVGAGWAAGSVVRLDLLGMNFFLPLLLSPILALTATIVLYPCFHWLRVRMQVAEQTCFCIGQQLVEVAPMMDEAATLRRVEALSVQVGNTVTCRRQYDGKVLGIEASQVLDRLHYLSAGVVSFARGLNDTPKIAALLLLAPYFGGFTSTALVGIMIAIGGILGAKQVAETMSRRITLMNHGQGFTANLITGVIVILASRLGVPVSTTHVSCGALFGIGTITRQAELGTIGKILGAWFTTLPLGALLGAGCLGLIRLIVSN